MDIFSQRKFLIRSVILLVMLNLVVIVFFSWKISHPRRQPPPPPQELISLLTKELNLTAQQAGDFKKIRDNFFREEKILSENTRHKRDSINSLMFSNNANDTLLKKLAAGVSENELKMELMRIEQAHQLRQICTPEQLDKFEILVREIRDYLKPEDNQRQP